MREFTLETEPWLPRPLEEVFFFFSQAGNLQEITPAWVNFQVLTPQPIEMHAGRLIDYRIRINGLPVRWRTKIEVREPPYRFVDVQLLGPYHLWRHTHTFENRDGGTVCRDQVRYQPMGGALLNWLFVRKDVERIFNYRREQLEKIFHPKLQSLIVG